MPFGLQGSSSVLMRVMNAAMTRGLLQNLSTPAAEAAVAAALATSAGSVAARGVLEASGPLHWSVAVYMDDLLCYSPSLEQHIRACDVLEVLVILLQEKLYTKASKCAFVREELGFLGHRVSGVGVSVDPSKVATVRNWPTT
jgi:hypothetical protein